MKLMMPDWEAWKPSLEMKTLIIQRNAHEHEVSDATDLALGSDTMPGAYYLTFSRRISSNWTIT